MVRLVNCPSSPGIGPLNPLSLRSKAVTFPAASVVTPCQSPAFVVQFVLVVQLAPPVASYNASRTVRSVPVGTAACTPGAARHNSRTGSASQPRQRTPAAAGGRGAAPPPPDSHPVGRGLQPDTAPRMATGRVGCVNRPGGVGNFLHAGLLPFVPVRIPPRRARGAVNQPQQ